MEIERVHIAGAGGLVPAVRLLPASPRGVAVVVHSYGGCKEETLGLAWRIADAGCAALAIDHRGHGEHLAPLDDGVLEEIAGALHGDIVYLEPTFALVIEQLRRWLE